MRGKYVIMGIVAAGIVGVVAWVNAQGIFNNPSVTPNPTDQVTATTTPMQPTAAITTSQESMFREKVYKIAVQDVILMRAYIRSAVSNSSDMATIKSQMATNNQAMVDVVRAFYGDAVANQIGTLANNKFTALDAVVSAAKGTDQQKFNEAGQQWKQAIDQLATTLSQINPDWPKDAIVNQLDNNLVLILKDMNALAKNDAQTDMSTFNSMLDNALSGAEMISASIISQFPNQFNK